MDLGRHEIIAKYNEPVTIAFLGDVHSGNANHNEEALAKAAAMIRDNGWFYVFMGDQTDCIINSQDPRWNPVELSAKYSLRDLKDLPRKQADEVTKHFKGIEDKCLAILCGNHEEAYHKRHAFNVYHYFASSFPRALTLGYTGVMVLSIATCGGKNTTGDKKKAHSTRVGFVLNHGDGGGGKTAGYIKNKLSDLAKFWQEDFFIAAHLHKLETGSHVYYKANRFGTDLETRVIQYGMCGCFLESFVKGNSSYFEHKGVATSDIGFLKASLDVNCQGLVGTRDDKGRRWQKNFFLEPVWIT